MKLLLDESVPRRLAVFFPESYIVRMVQQMGGADTGNGRLLFLAAGEHLGVLVMVDRGIEHQQNVGTLPISVVVMSAPRNRLRETATACPWRGLGIVRRPAEAYLPCCGLSQSTCRQCRHAVPD